MRQAGTVPLGGRAIEAFHFSTLPGASGPWRKPIEGGEVTTARHVQAMARRGQVQQVRQLVSELRDACVIALQGFVGMRISEVCGLRAYPLSRATGLPACVEMRSSRSGLNEVFYVKGRLFKTTDNEQEVTWVAGLRPRGTDYLPPPIRALIVLERLFKPWRDLAGRPDLIVSFPKLMGLPKYSTSVGAITTENLRLGQRDWIGRHVTLPPDLAHWRVTSHQWRKSFALYAIRTDSRMLAAVSQHFKHVSLAMTEQGYIGNDIELLGIMEDMATRETARILYEITTGETVAGGKMAELIRERAAKVGAHLAGKTEEERFDEMERMVRSTDVRVWSCDWGWCFFRAETARCHMGESVGRSRAQKPNDAVRSPNTCCACANLATTLEHVPFWTARREKWRQALKQHQRDGNGEFVLVARERINQCDTILRLIGPSARCGSPSYVA
jgi:hypothetical protein